WFGWFGFNAGSAPHVNGVAVLAFMTTHLGAAGGALAWLAIEWLHRQKPTAGFVAPWAAIVIGAAASGVCYVAVLAKYKYGYDDTLDAFGVHGVGGLTGALLTGVFAQAALNPDGANGALFGNPHQLGVQALACGASGGYALVMTFVILKV